MLCRQKKALPAVKILLSSRNTYPTVKGKGVRKESGGDTTFGLVEKDGRLEVRGLYYKQVYRSQIRSIFMRSEGVFFITITFELDNFFIITEVPPCGRIILYRSSVPFCMKSLGCTQYLVANALETRFRNG